MKKAKIVKYGKYSDLLSDISKLLEDARRASARSINSILTATYWEIGRRIVEFEQKGSHSAEYGKEIIPRLAEDLAAHFGRGFSKRNLFQIRLFYIRYAQKVQTVSAQLTDLPLEDINKISTNLGATITLRYPLMSIFLRLRILGILKKSQIDIQIS